MKKKFLLMMMLSLLFTAMGTSVLNAQNENGNVAKVGDTEYATIDEAIAAWTNGTSATTTLTLLTDVTLSDVVTIKSTEHHILNLGTYTMTAASDKNAFVIQACGNGSAEKYAITINADATNPGGINAGSKCIIYYKYADGGISTEDRPIIKINGGVFTGSTSSWGTAGIYTIGTAARKCATLNISGGTFNCSINGSGKSKLIVSGGVFNYSVGSQGDSTALRLISGGTFKSFGFMTADDNNTKFWIGTSMGNSNVGVYVDDNGYLVVGGPVITELSPKYQAKASNYSKWSSYLEYSSAAANGLYYTNAEKAIAKHGEANVIVYEHADSATELAGNTAVNNFNNNIDLPSNVSSFSIELAKIEGASNAATKVTFNVEPKDADGNKVSNPSSAITFRLPVPASWEGKAKVYHENDLLGKYAIATENYVEVVSDNFSEFAVEQIVPLFEGEGTEESPYLINSIDKLVALRDEVNAGETYEGVYFELDSDITLTGEWTPIGNGSRSSKTYNGNSFKGVFDGKNKTISGLTITSTTGDDAAVGLFGVVDGGTVENLNLTDVNIDVASSDLAGAAIGMMLDGATADKITVSGTIVGHDGVGGIVGRLIIDGTISNCINNASVTSSYGGIGGIVGKAYYEDGADTSTFASVTECTNNGTITAPKYVGGIVGLARANVTECVNNGAVVGGTQTGGIIGQLIAAGTVSANENIAIISGTNHLGGIIGDYTQSNAYTYYNVSIANNINRGEVSATQCAAIMGCNNIDGFTAMTATGNVSYYWHEGLELFATPYDMVIDNTNKFIIPVAQVGEQTFYTLAEAVAEATEGETITMLADAAEDVTIHAGVTFNGNGKAVGNITAAGTITFNGHTKATSFSVEYTNTTINIVEGACLEITGTGRMVIGHGCTFNITGTIAEAKTANVADLTPSLIMPGASFTGAGVTFNVTNAYIKTISSYCSSKNSSANSTFDFNIENSIWEQYGSLVFSEPTNGMDPTVNFELRNSVLNSTSHLVFAVTKGDVVFDNSNVNVGTRRQIENRSTMTIKNGSVVNGAVATSSNAKNPGTLIVDNATYDVEGEFSGSDLGTGTIVYKKGATISAGKITNANIQIDATGMKAGDEVNITANLANLAGTIEVINNDNLEASIVDGKVVLAAKPAAKIGEQGYATLADAYEAAVDGDVIVLNESVTTFPVIKKAVTFKGGKENAAVEINVFLAQNFTAINGTVKFENLTFNKPLFTEQGGTKPGLTIEFEGCNFNVPSDEGYAILIGTSWSNSVVKGLKVNECNFKYVGDVFKGGYMLYVQCVNEVSITNNTIDGNNLYRGAIHLGDATEHATVATVSNNTIKNFCRGVMMGNRVVGSSATISGNTFDNINYNDKDSKPAQECAPIFIHSNATAEALQIALTNNKVENCTNPMIYSEDTDLIKYYVTEFTGNTVDGVAVELANSYNAPNQIFPVATINDAEYFTLQAAVNAVQNGETITLLSDITENVTVTQKADVKFTIDGAKQSRAADDNYTFTGYIIVDGKSSAYATAGVTIKNLNFDAKGIATDASINLGDEGNINNTRYTSNVTVDNCTFTGENQAKAAVKSYTGGDKNLTITNCTVDATMHSLAQLTNVDGVVIDNCTVNSKNGINLNSSANVVVENSKFEVGGYPVRIGVNEGTSGKVELTNNTLKTDNSEGDAAIVIRGTASTQVELTMTKNIVSGTTHISGTTEATNITADANYWDGQSAPVVAEGSTPVEVDTYYTALNEDGTIDEDSLKETPQGNQPIAYVKEVDGYVRVWGETWGNAKESYALELYSGETKIATTVLNNVGGIINGSVNVTWNFFYPESTDEYWTTTWHEEPQADKQPDKVVLVIDGVAVNEGPVYMSGADGINPVVWADLGGVISGGTWGGIDWTLVDGTLTITPTTGTPTTDNSGKWSYEIGQWPEAVIYNNNGVGVDIGLWPYERTKVKTLVIEEGVTSIGSFTAQGFTNLTGEVEIPYTVKYIGQEAFQRSTMTKLTFAPVPEGETGEELCIAQGALKNLVIEEITFPEDRPVHLHAWMFANSNNLKHVTFPATVVGIGGTVHVDYQHNPNATNGGGSNSCGLLSKCPALETITFGSQEVRDMYYNPYYERNDAPIVVNVGLKSYKDFRAGINAAKDGETVLLLGNVTLEDTWTIPAGMNLTLDLNGKTINAGWADQSAGKHIYAFENHGTLTIKGEGTINARGNFNYGAMTLTSGTINAIDGNGGYGVRNYPGATFTMNGGTIATTLEDDNKVDKGGYDASPVRVDEGATFTMNDGVINNICDFTVAIDNYGTTIINDGKATTVHTTLANSGTMTINGGEFTCNGLEGITAHALWAAAGTTTINGGTFNGKDKYNGFNVDASAGATVYITGGNFLPVHSGSLYGEGTIAVSGGTFFDEVPEECCAAGYIPKVNSDGTYGVVEGLAGEGTEENPYLIKSLTDLKFFRNQVNTGNTYAGKYIKVTATEIDLNNEEWTPIGTNDNPFNGTFDGQDHTISNLTITGYNSNVGFFGRTNNGEIKNITIKNAKVSGRLNVGVVAGTPYTSKYTNIKVTGHVEVNGMAYVGGVGGKDAYANWTDITVNVDGTSYVKANSVENGTAYRTYVGGVIGFNGEGGHTFKNITSNIKVIGSTCDIGGIFGIAHYGNNFENIEHSGSVINETNDATDALETGLIAGVWHNAKGTSVTFTNAASSGTISAPYAGVTFPENSLVGAAYTPSNETSGTSGSLVINGETVYPYVAKIGDAGYNTLAKAVTAAQDGETIQLLWAEGDASIAMNASLYGKSVTITGTATVDWNKGFLFVGRGGAGNATLTFDGANLTSASNSSSYGIHVSGREKGTDNKYDGTLVIKNGSNIQLDYLIDRGTITIDNATLTVKNGFGIAGRPASETEDNKPATATISLENGANLIVNNHNGMGVGQAAKDPEGYGIMNINSGSTFETTQSFTVTAMGTMNVNGGNVETVGTLTNNGEVNVNEGENTLNITTLEDKEIKLQHGATLVDTNVGGEAMLYGAVTFKGDNTFTMIYDYGAAYSTESAAWTVEPGASLTLTATVRYGLGYGDNATIKGNITDALTARGTLTDDDLSFFTHGISMMCNWNEENYLTVNDAYVQIGSNNSFGTKNDYGQKGKFYVNFTNSVLTSSRVTIVENGGFAYFTFNGSDVLTGGWSQKHAGSTAEFTNSKMVVTGNGTDYNNANAGMMTIVGSNIEFESGAFTNTGTLNIGENSTFTAPEVVNNGTINFTALSAKLDTDTEGLTIVDQVNNPDYKVVYKEGAYQFVPKDYVAQIGEDKYESLQEAVNVGGEVTVLQDITLTEGITVAADKTVVLDLNGKTISMQDASNNSAYAIKNNGSLTIKDSAEGGKITFNSTTPDNNAVPGYSTSTIGNGGKLTVMNGTIENTTVGGASYAVDGIWHTGEASLTINDGTITATQIAVRQVPFSATAKNTVTINGGILTGATAGLQMFNINGEAKLSETIIKGGTFNGTYAFYTSFTSAQASELATINIDGGTFNGYVFLYNGKDGSNAYPMTVAITDGLFNRGAYIYTKDANGNEVPIKAITGGTFSEDPSEYCAPDYSPIFNGSTYTVIKTSGTFTRTLSSGWSWFSYYIDIEGSNGLDALKEDMGAACEQFKSHTAFTFYSNNKWYTGPNALTGTNVEDMYMVKMRESKEISLSGKLAVPEEEKITLKANGWTWIGYPLENSINVSDALATFNSIEGDYIKSKTLYAEYVKLSNGTYAWKGSLNSMIPGEGYKYKSVSGDEKEVYYSSASNRTAVKANVTSENNYWVASNSKYSSNMTVVAMMSIDNEIVNDSYEIAAFANGECRGSARAIYDEDLNAYMLYLTIHGEDVENITFKYYDVNYGTEYELGNVVVYSSDAILGSINNPYMFNLDILNVDEASINEVNVYPNPTTTNAEIDLNATCDKVEVFNALGVKVAEYSNVDSIDALETAGVYVIRVTIDGNVRNCRLVVK